MRIYIQPTEIDWQAMNRDLKGERALIAAIIAQAYYDLVQGEVDAGTYFISAIYRHHLELLDLPAHWLPIGVTVEQSGPGLQIVAVEEHIYELPVAP